MKVICLNPNAGGEGKERRKSRKNEERKEGKSVSVLAAELRLGCGC